MATTIAILTDEAEPLDLCEYCGEPSDQLQAVEESDPETGYYAVSALCPECRRAPLAREAEEFGGLRADALVLLGVGEDWLNDEPVGVVRKPMTIAPALIPGEERQALSGGGL